MWWQDGAHSGALTPLWWASISISISISITYPNQNRVRSAWGHKKNFAKRSFYQTPQLSHTWDSWTSQVKIPTLHHMSQWAHKPKMHVELATSTSLPDLYFWYGLWQGVWTLRRSWTEASPSISTNSVAVLRSSRDTHSGANPFHSSLSTVHAAKWPWCVPEASLHSAPHKIHALWRRQSMWPTCSLCLFYFTCSSQNGQCSYHTRHLCLLSFLRHSASSKNLFD